MSDKFPPLHIVNDGALAHAALNYLKYSLGQEGTLLSPGENRAFCDLPTEGILIVTNDGQKHVPPVEFSDNLHVVFIESWDPDHLSNIMQGILDDKEPTPVNETRRILPWGLRYNGQSFERAHVDRSRQRRVRHDF